MFLVTPLAVVMLALLAVGGLALIAMTFALGGKDRRVKSVYQANALVMLAILVLGTVESRSWLWGGSRILGEPLAVGLIGILATTAFAFAHFAIAKRKRA